jgi:hypothetical protein
MKLTSPWPLMSGHAAKACGADATNALTSVLPHQ